MVCNGINVYAYQKIGPLGEKKIAIFGRYALVARAGLGLVGFASGTLAHAVTLYACFAYSHIRASSGGGSGHTDGDGRQGKEPDSMLDSTLDSTLDPQVSTPNIRSLPRPLSALVPPSPARLATVLGGMPAETTGLLRGYTAQALLKVLLSEGEKLLVVARRPLHDQAVYSLVTSLGSIAARFLFQPLEELAAVSFSRLGGSGGSSGRSGKSGGGGGGGNSGSGGGAGQGASDALVARLLVLLVLLVRLVTHLGLIFAAFGPPYARILLCLLYGSESWACSDDAAEVLGGCVWLIFFCCCWWYCLLKTIPFSFLEISKN
jgi:hypothetical protein